MNARNVAHKLVGSAARKQAAYMMTSWDNGHPRDQRVAVLLSRYGLRGTFYVPRQAENDTMPASQIRDLSRTFEVGAHTLTLHRPGQRYSLWSRYALSVRRGLYGASHCSP